MTSKKTDDSNEAAADSAPHPMDEWLRRELGALGTTGDDPLPPDMADLAGRLEAALAGHKKQQG